MDSPCIKQTVCKVFKIFQCGMYLVAYVLKGLMLINCLPASDIMCRLLMTCCKQFGPSCRAASGSRLFALS